ncbi:FAD-binding oxidoreductase (plasmid) [Lichenicola cladoniae]|uniref:FAD-binding oxidoreductase n=1 Tax=Lichenicola cladoniae TaxID=1484109 RepID=A0A6M8HXZ0_9PROT|nr:FAD-binding oxidoreductase [Lichenicola cladoniae]NPD68675.1 FAD-binding oxidoreductase [Acetobacteraceae bacterium]QKE93057.1 FAD-binding oxidoreductase [Lichenicola cladoniae]
MTRPDSFHRSLWSAITPSGSAFDRAEGRQRFDVVVVGGGLLGLSTALALAEKGASVGLVERDEAGFGASGRNTGFVVPALKGSVDPGRVAHRLPGNKVEPLLRLVSGSGDAVFALIDRLKIACAPEQNGCLQPAPTEAALASVEAQVRAMAPLGVNWQVLDANETFQRTGIPGYVGSMLLPTGGQLNPLAYTRGLASAVRGAGGTLLAGRVVALARQSGAWHLDLANGAELVAGNVVLATNALLEGLVPEVSRSLVPVHAYQVATQPLDVAYRDRILRHRQPSVDLRNHPLAVRWSPDNRLVTGGGALWHGTGAVDRMARFFLRRLEREIPDLPLLRPDFAWSGIIGGTGDFLPRLWDLGDGMYAPIGCNGRGVALTTALGNSLGRFLLDRDEAALPLPLTRPRPWRFHGAMRHAPLLWLAQGRLRDWRNEKRAGRPGG